MATMEEGRDTVKEATTPLVPPLIIRRNSAGEATIAEKRPKPSKTKSTPEVPEKKRKKETGPDGAQRSPTATTPPKQKPASSKNGAIPPAVAAAIASTAATAIIPKKQPAKKVTVMQSSLFAEALSASDEVKKAAPKKKKPVATSNGKTKEANVHAPHVLPTVFDEVFNPKPAAAPQPPPAARVPPPTQKVEVAEEPNITAPGKRRIRFADEHGMELTQVRFFEIEEGERLNVNRFTPEELKHYEMQQERIRRQETHAPYADDEEEQPRTKLVKWRLIVVDRNDDVTVQPGSKSEAKVIELQRQSRVIEAFWDPNNPTSHIDEPDEFDPLSVHIRPKEIPLEEEEVRAEPPAEVKKDLFILNNSQFQQPPTLQMPVIQQPVAPSVVVPAPTVIPTTPAPVIPAGAPSVLEQPAKALPPGLQNLMDRLKRQGMVADDSKPPVVAAPAIQQIQVPQISQPQSQTQYAQLPTYQQLPYVQPAQQPTYAQSPAPEPSTSTTGGIQLLSGIDVHSAALPGEFNGGPGPFNGPQAYPPGTRPPLRQCSFYFSTTCRFGDRCHFSHGDEPTLGSKNYALAAATAAPPRRPPFRDEAPPPRREDRFARGGGFRGGEDRFGRGGFRGRGGRFGRDFDRDFDRRDRDRDRDRRRRSRSRSRSRSWSPRRRDVSPLRDRGERHDREERRRSRDDEDRRREDRDRRRDEERPRSDEPKQEDAATAAPIIATPEAVST